MRLAMQARSATPPMTLAATMPAWDCEWAGGVVGVLISLGRLGESVELLGLVELVGLVGLVEEFVDAA